jgi:hypothetical protein
MTRLHFSVLGLMAVVGFAIGYGFHAWASIREPAAIAPTERHTGPAEPSPITPPDAESHRRTDGEAMKRLAQIHALPNPFAQKEALYALAGRADLGALDTLIGEATSIRDTVFRGSALAVLFERYAELAAPATAMRAISRLDDADVRQLAVRAIAETWSQTDPAAAYAYGLALEDRDLQASFVAGVVRQWTQSDPVVALRHLSDRSHGRRAIMQVYQAMGALAAHDPERAFELAGQLDPADLRSAAQQAVIQTWAREDASAVAERIEAMPPSPGRRELEQLLAEQYAREHPDEAIAWAQRRSGPAGIELLTAVLNGIAQEDAERAVDIASTFDTGTLQRQALSTVISNLAWQRPEVAAQFVDRLPAGAERADAMQQIAGAWGEQDPDAASAWAAGLDEPLRSRAMLNIGSHLAYMDPERATDIVHQLKGAPRAQLVQEIASGWAQTDPGRAREWISQFEGEGNYPQLVSAVAQGTAAHDPRAALDLAAGIEGEEARDGAIGSIVHTWASTDPESAAIYVERLPSPSARLAAVNGVVSGWARYDPAATRTWASGLKPDAVRDQALYTLVMQSTHAPDDYVAIIGEIRSESQRADAIQQAVHSLAYSDRDAARLLLQRLPASAEQKESLQCFLDDPSNFAGY